MIRKKKKELTKNQLVTIKSGKYKGSIGLIVSEEGIGLYKLVTLLNSPNCNYVGDDLLITGDKLK